MTTIADIRQALMDAVGEERISLGGLLRVDGMLAAVEQPRPNLREHVRVDVTGHPAPKGSKRAFVRGGKAVLVDDNSEAKRAWHQDVADAAVTAMKRCEKLVIVPVAVAVEFRLRRPAGHYGKRGLRPSAPAWPAVKPDLDKLVRCTMDPLEGLVFDGDSRIVSIDARKRYCEDGEAEGAVIAILEVLS